MKKLLESHGIETKVENGILFALDIYFDRSMKEFSQWVNTTNWQTYDALLFLGY